MDTLKTNLCEEPLYVFITLILAALVMIVMWHSSRKTLYLKLLALPLVLGVAVFAMDYFIITDREQINQASQEIAADLEAGKLDAAVTYLDENYGGYNVSKPLLLKFAQKQIDKLQIKSVNLSHVTVTITGKQADMTITSVLTLGGQYEGKYALKWRLHWVKRPQGWRIQEVSEPEQTVPGF